MIYQNQKNIKEIKYNNKEIIEGYQGDKLIFKKSQSIRRISYIESTGTQYIDLGITPLQSDTFFVTFAALNDGCIFGSRTAYSNSAPWYRGIYLVAYKSQSKYRISSAHNSNYDETYTQYISATIGNKDNFTIDGAHWILNNKSYNYSRYSNIANGLNYYLFCNHTGTTTSDMIKARIYSFEILNRIKLVPYLDENNVPFFLNEATGIRYYNKGTGNFLYN